MIRNRYNRIPHPALNTKRERDAHNEDDKTKTAQAKSQGDSSFPTSGHNAIINKLNSKSKTKESGRALTIRINHNRSIVLERPVTNYWGRLKPVLRSSNLTLGTFSAVLISQILSAYRSHLRLPELMFVNDKLIQLGFTGIDFIHLEILIRRVWPYDFIITYCEFLWVYDLS